MPSCNRWMLRKADYVITYTANPYGNAAALAASAYRAGKICIELHDSPDH